MDNAADKPANSSSHYVKIVVLQEWWLVRSREEYEGWTLAISGLPINERAVRVFNSAPVVKRYSFFTVETADGVYVFLQGFINRLRTAEGGFSSEVFKDFLFGFPHNWEQYARKKLVDDECLRSKPSPKIVVNGHGATVNQSKRTENVSIPAEVDIEAVKVTSHTPKNSTADEMKRTPREIGCETEILPPTREGEEIPEQSRSQKHRRSETEVPRSPADIRKGTPLKLKTSQVESEKHSKNSDSNEISENGKSLRGRKIAAIYSSVDIIDGTSKASQNFGAFAVEDISSVKATPIANNSKNIGNSTKCKMGAMSGVKDVKTKLSFDCEESASIQGGLDSPYLLTEISNMKKSRSGRLLLRPLEFWRNQKAIYDGSRQITGIVNGTLDSDKVSSTGRNRKRKC
uniref:SANTA domain-containing protein n=1 Tax=Kalanchoe fedtschenkoi TaxID=63787 RepID=A0A7N1A558_KALFE